MKFLNSKAKSCVGVAMSIDSKELNFGSGFNEVDAKIRALI